MCTRVLRLLPNTCTSDSRSMDHAPGDADADIAFAAAHDSDFLSASPREIFIANIHA